MGVGTPRTSRSRRRRACRRGSRRGRSAPCAAAASRGWSTSRSSARREALQWMVQMNCIDMNAWYSRVDRPDRPDYVVFDLDPPGRSRFALCDPRRAPAARAARVARAALVREDEWRGRHPRARSDRASLRLRRYVRVRRGRRATTRGGEPGRRDDRVAEAQARGRPSRPPAERPRQDACLRLLRAPEAGRAGVDAAPLGRAGRGCSAARFTMSVALERVAVHGDLFAPTLAGGQSLGAALKRLT